MPTSVIERLAEKPAALDMDGEETALLADQNVAWNRIRLNV